LAAAIALSGISKTVCFTVFVEGRRTEIRVCWLLLKCTLSWSSGAECCCTATFKKLRKHLHRLGLQCGSPIRTSDVTGRQFRREVEHCAITAPTSAPSLNPCFSLDERTATFGLTGFSLTIGSDLGNTRQQTGKSETRPTDHSQPTYQTGALKLSQTACQRFSQQPVVGPSIGALRSSCNVSDDPLTHLYVSRR
jgi:hypothetical protein